MTGWIWILGCMGAAALLILWLWWENNALQMTGITEANAKIPPCFDGFRIVQVSDLHNKSFGRGQSRLLEKIRLLDPDIIVITGDLIYGAHIQRLRQYCRMDHALDFVRGAVRIAPVYYIPGNHEGRSLRYDVLRTGLEKAGVRVMREEKLTLERDGQRIHLIGSGTADFAQTEAEQKNAVREMLAAIRLAADRPEEYQILLVHHPEFFAGYCAAGVDLVFAGHAHGGQIRLPGIGGLLAPGQGMFPRYVSGIYRKNKTALVVSRGLGRSLFPFRINNRPELVCVTLKKERKSEKDGH